MDDCTYTGNIIRMLYTSWYFSPLIITYVYEYLSNIPKDIFRASDWNGFTGTQFGKMMIVKEKIKTNTRMYALYLKRKRTVLIKIKRGFFLTKSRQNLVKMFISTISWPICIRGHMCRKTRPRTMSNIRKTLCPL